LPSSLSRYSALPSSQLLSSVRVPSKARFRAERKMAVAARLDHEQRHRLTLARLMAKLPGRRRDTLASAIHGCLSKRA
jgi:hypothetical protein